MRRLFVPSPSRAPVATASAVAVSVLLLASVAAAQLSIASRPADRTTASAVVPAASLASSSTVVPAGTGQPRREPDGGPTIGDPSSHVDEPVVTATVQEPLGELADGVVEGPVDRIDADVERRLEAALDAWLSEDPSVSAVVAAVAVGGHRGERWSGNAGPSDRSDATDAIDIAVDDRYGILSVTKTFTEALVLREARAGRIALDEPMPPLPDVDPAPPDVVITPRHLLQHASGLVNYPDAAGYDPDAPITPAEAVTLALRTPLRSPPGTEAYYANTNFHWLGLLLESATGRPFGDLVAELAGDVGAGSLVLDPASRPGWVGFASGGMAGTIGDVARWGAALFTSSAVLEADELDEYVEIGPLGVGLGVWPLCPCATADDGTTSHSAIGQIVAHGGLVHIPGTDVVVAVRMEGAPEDVSGRTVALALALRDALGRAE